MKLKSKLLDSIPTIDYSFGTALEPIDSLKFPHWDILRPQWKQVHGTHLLEVTSTAQECHETDGLYTSTPGIPIGIVTADCVPLLLAHPQNNFIMAVHAGWRGTYASIHSEIEKVFLKKNISLSEVYACIGPCIHPCCYEVSEELVQNFKLKFKDILSDHDIEPKKRKLNLPNIHYKLLSSLGIKNIETISICTQCAIDSTLTPLMNSFRRDSSKLRQYSIISIKKK